MYTVDDLPAPSIELRKALEELISRYKEGRLSYKILFICTELKCIEGYYGIYCDEMSKSISKSTCIEFQNKYFEFRHLCKISPSTTLYGSNAWWSVQIDEQKIKFIKLILSV